ncbi:hypothetical protein [Pseudonocardia spinosispora]|uniref:hypothetical protein n=1 Tax=Pseudonocardia spinosispora TaxID=103441 RepID=UPI00040617C0|nr:hypothetical protein [Pseudonocardia spinosispora]
MSPTEDEIRRMIRELLRELLPALPDPARACGHRVEAKAVLERHVVAAAQAGVTELVIGPRAVLTPLAKDKIRTLGLTVRRED